MDIFLQDPDEIPLPPEEVRIRELKITSNADNSRIQVYIEVDPFQKRPNIDLMILDGLREIASTSIIESIMRKMELTMHLAGVDKDSKLVAKASLYFRDDLDEEKDYHGVLPEPTIVDVVEKKFQFSN